MTALGFHDVIPSVARDLGGGWYEAAPCGTARPHRSLPHGRDDSVDNSIRAEVSA